MYYKYNCLDPQEYVNATDDVMTAVIKYRLMRRDTIVYKQFIQEDHYGSESDLI